MPSPPLIILGVDPGTHHTGYGIITTSGHTHKALEYGVITTQISERLSHRYAHIYDEIITLIARHKPHAIAVETQYVARNAQSTLKLTIARGMVLLAAAKSSIDIFEYAPSKAKKAIGASGAATKEQVQSMVKLLLALPTPPTPHDAADALALALCHANAYHHPTLKGAIT